MSGEPVRLQKILAHAGLGSRRACEELILQGRVTVDGTTVRELGFKVDPAKSKVTVDGQKVSEEKLVYFAVNKPKGYLSTNEDPDGRLRVVDLLPEIPQRVYTIGRLDEASVGLILVTNDGDLANQLAHPKFGVEKLYRVTLAGLPGPEVVTQLTEGIWLSDGKVRAKRARIIARRGQSTIMDIVLAEGKNREIRRMLARFGHKVMNLTRMAIGPIVVKGLQAGGVRALTRQEVDLLHKIGSGRISGTVAAFKPFDSRANFKSSRPAPGQGQGPRSVVRARGDGDRERGPQPRDGQAPRRPDFRGQRPERPQGDFRGRPRFQPDRGQAPNAGTRPPQGPNSFRDRNRDDRDGDRGMRTPPPPRGRDDRQAGGAGQDRRPARPFAKPGMGAGPRNQGPPRPFAKPGMGAGSRDQGPPRPFAKPGMGAGPRNQGPPRPFAKPPGPRPMAPNSNPTPNRPTGPLPTGPASARPNSNSDRPRPVLGPPRPNHPNTNAPDGPSRPRPALGPPRPRPMGQGYGQGQGQGHGQGQGQGPKPFRPNPAFKPKPKPLGPPGEGAPPARKIIGLEPQEREAFDMAGLPASERRKRMQMRMRSNDINTGPGGNAGPRPKARPGMGRGPSAGPKFGKTPPRTLGRPLFKPNRQDKPGPSEPDES